MNAILRVALLAAFLSPAFPVAAQTPIAIGPERIISPPEPGPLGPASTSRALAPLWTGHDWIAVWFDTRDPHGIHAQRVGPEGGVRLLPNPRLAPGRPRSFVRLGSGYLLGGDAGVWRLDEELDITETLPDTPPNIVSNGTTALAWESGLTTLQIVTPAAVFELDAEAVAGGEPATAPVAVAAGSDHFVVAWRSPSEGGPDRINVNFLRPDGAVMLDEPLRFSEVGAEVLDLSASWDGQRYVLAWTSRGARVPQLWIATAGPDGAGPAEWLGPGGSNIQSNAVASGVVLVSWNRSEGPGQAQNRGLLVTDGEPSPEPFSISERAAVIGADGAGRLATFTLERTELQLWNLNTREPDFSDAITPVTDPFGLRYGVLSMTRLVTDPGTPLALWTRHSSASSQIMLGRFDEGRGRLRTLEVLGEESLGYDLASGSDRNLVVWGEWQSGRRSIVGRIATDSGSWAGAPVALGDGHSPRATAHDGGWLVFWTTQSNLLEYVFLDAGGQPGIPLTVAEPLPVPSGTTVSQGYPSFVKLGQSETLVAWQEGDVRGLCQILCIEHPAPGVIRTMRFRSGIVESQSLRSYDDHATSRGRPAAAIGGENILLTWIEQTGEYETEIRGVLTNRLGDDPSSPFTIGRGPWLEREPVAPSVVALENRFVVIWDHGERYSPQAELRGAVVEPGDDGALVTGPFRVTGSSVHAMQSQAMRHGAASVIVFYSRNEARSPWEGIWELASRVISLDPPARRRTMRRP
jgi:hypothetical protein